MQLLYAITNNRNLPLWIGKCICKLHLITFQPSNYLSNQIDLPCNYTQNQIQLSGFLLNKLLILASYFLL